MQDQQRGTAAAQRSLPNDYVITYGTVDRLWHDGCRKHENLPDRRDSTVRALIATHVCGPRTSAWTSPGVS